MKLFLFIAFLLGCFLELTLAAPQPGEETKKIVKRSFWDDISSVGTNVFDGVGTVGTNVFDGIGTVGTNVYDGIGTVGTHVKDGIETVGTNVYDGIETVGTNVYDGIETGISAAKTVTKTSNTVTNVFDIFG